MWTDDGLVRGGGGGKAGEGGFAYIHRCALSNAEANAFSNIRLVPSKTRIVCRNSIHVCATLWPFLKEEKEEEGEGATRGEEVGEGFGSVGSKRI